MIRPREDPSIHVDVPREIYSMIILPLGKFHLHALLLVCKQWLQIMYEDLEELPMPTCFRSFPRQFTGITAVTEEHNGFVFQNVKLTRLRTLHTHKNVRMSNAMLTSLTTLRNLTVYADRFLMSAVGKMSSLTHLRICEWPRDSLSALSGLVNLTSLVPPYVDEGNYIPVLPKLQYLYLWGNVNSVRNEDLSMMTTLTYLDLDQHRGITNESVGYLTGLTHLDLMRNNCITNASVSRLTNLTKLIVDEKTPITLECLLRLPKLNLITLNDYGMVTPCNHPISRHPFAEVKAYWY